MLMTTLINRRSKTATELLEDARENMLYNLPFFGTLALELDLVEDNKIKGSCTDGSVIRYNGQSIIDMPYETREYLLAHEVLHCAFGHHARRGDRGIKRWNKACDLVVDRILLDSGFTLPAERMQDYKQIMQIGDNTAEKVYDLIEPIEGDEGGSGGTGDPDPETADNEGKPTGEPESSGTEGSDGQCGTQVGDGFGEVKDPSSGKSPTDINSNLKDWEGKVSKAASVAKRMGKGSRSLEIILDHVVKQNEVSWKEHLRDFVEKVTKGDYTWTQPNKRYLTTCGLYLPALFSRELGKIVIAIDTSGSIAERELKAFESELNAIFNDFPTHVVVMYCDTRVKKEDEFRAGDVITFKAKGGGGTSFTPVFEKQQQDHPDAECIIYFTDGYGRYPSESDKPTIWVLTEDHKPKTRYYPPFGKAIVLKLSTND